MPVIIGACVGALILLLAGCAYWFIFRDQTKNYASYQIINGVPQGIGSTVSKDGGQHYEMEYEKGKLKRILLADASGRGVTDADSLYLLYRPVEEEYFYDGDGRLNYKKIYNAEGNLLCKVDFDSQLTRADIEYEKIDSAAVKGVRLDYDDSTGRLSKLYYVDETGEKTARSGSVYGESFTYDGAGRLTRVSFLNADDTPVADVTGIGIIEFEYPGGKLPVTSKVYDISGRPVTPKAVPASSPKPAAKPANKPAATKPSAPKAAADKSYQNKSDAKKSSKPDHDISGHEALQKMKNIE